MRTATAHALVVAFLGVIVLPNASVAQDVCGFDDVLATEISFPPLLDETNTHLDFVDSQTVFEVAIEVPHIYSEYVRFGFQGAVDTSGGFDSTDATVDINNYWMLDNVTDECYAIYSAQIPWDDFRTSLGGENGVAEVRLSDSVSYFSVIEISVGRLVSIDAGDPIVQNVGLLVPFEVHFELQHVVEGNTTVNRGTVDVTAAITDSSVLTVNPDDNPLATAQLIFVTSVPGPLRLAALGVETDSPNLDFNLNITEIVDDAQCDVEDDFCRQFWIIHFEPEQCTLDGMFTAMFEGECHPDAANCLAPIDNLVDVVMTTSSDNFCGITQQVSVHGEIVLDAVTQCNGVLAAVVECSVVDDIVGGLNSTELIVVRASPSLGGGGYLDVYDEENNIVNFNYAAIPLSATQVQFSFDWDSSEFQCDVTAVVEVTVLVEYQATRSLTTLLLAAPGAPAGTFGSGRNRRHHGKQVKLAQVSELAQSEQNVYVSATGAIAPSDESAEVTDDSADAAAATTTTVTELPVWGVVLLAILGTGCCFMCAALAVGICWYVRREGNEDKQDKAAAGKKSSRARRSSGEKKAAGHRRLDSSASAPKPEGEEAEIELTEDTGLVSHTGSGSGGSSGNNSNEPSVAAPASGGLDIEAQETKVPEATPVAAAS